MALTPRQLAELLDERARWALYEASPRTTVYINIGAK